MPFPGTPHATHLHLTHGMRLTLTAAQIPASGVVTINTLPLAGVALRVLANVTTAFTAGTAISVGTATNSKTGTVGNASALMAAGAAAGQLNAPAAGVYTATPYYVMPDDQDIVLTITGAPTAGALDITIEHYPHPQ